MFICVSLCARAKTHTFVRTLAATRHAPCLDIPRSLLRVMQRCARVVASCARTNVNNALITSSSSAAASCCQEPTSLSRGVDVYARAPVYAAYLAREHVPEPIRSENKHLVLHSALHTCHLQGTSRYADQVNASRACLRSTQVAALSCASLQQPTPRLLTYLWVCNDVGAQEMVPQRSGHRQHPHHAMAAI